VNHLQSGSTIGQQGHDDMAKGTHTATVPAEELQKIPFLAKPITMDRLIPCLYFYVEGEWHCWLVAGPELHKIKMFPVESNYFGDKPERETDQLFPLLDFIAQRALVPEVGMFFYGIWNDYQSLAATLAKLKLFFEMKGGKYEVRRFVQTEAEYIILVCRSLFDLLQEMISVYWSRIAFPDKKTKKLPKSFADVVRAGDTVRSASDIQAKYDLPEPMAQWYAKHADFFLKLRAMRDRLVHSGANAVEMLFVADNGFAISKELRPFCDLYQWPEGCEILNGLVPLRPVLCLLIQRVLDACCDFAAMIQTLVQFPTEMAPGLRLYSRGCFDQELSEVPSVIATGAW
jgi:hypothetical protein